MSHKVEDFDIRAENEHWDEIKRGLVDKEGFVRKQSLHMLKIALGIKESGQSSSGVSVAEAENQLMPRGNGMTKRELWADKEAKSLGVGKISSPAESCLSSQQKWEAFVLLYEMLEEYGTHLVEAAWNYQISLLLQFSTTRVPVAISGSGAFHQNQIETPGKLFSWLAILWERGFHHDNPQVRCLIMQSFLGIDWKNDGTHAKEVPENFVLGPLLEGLNDPVHHKEFGLNGIYSSLTIEDAARFLCHYTSCLNASMRLAFLVNLASTARVKSFGRAGLMCLSECISSAAYQVRTDNNESEAQWLEDAIPGTIPMENPPSGKVLLDALRFIIESSKQHFNPNYRLRGL